MQKTLVLVLGLVAIELPTRASEGAAKASPPPAPRSGEAWRPADFGAFRGFSDEARRRVGGGFRDAAEAAAWQAASRELFESWPELVEALQAVRGALDRLAPETVRDWEQPEDAGFMVFGTPDLPYAFSWDPDDVRYTARVVRPRASDAGEAPFAEPLPEHQGICLTDVTDLAGLSEGWHTFSGAPIDAARFEPLAGQAVNDEPRARILEEILRFPNPFNMREEHFVEWSKDPLDTLDGEFSAPSMAEFEDADALLAVNEAVREAEMWVSMFKRRNGVENVMDALEAFPRMGPLGALGAAMQAVLPNLAKARKRAKNACESGLGQWVELVQRRTQIIGFGCETALGDLVGPSVGFDFDQPHAWVAYVAPQTRLGVRLLRYVQGFGIDLKSTRDGRLAGPYLAWWDNDTPQILDFKGAPAGDGEVQVNEWHPNGALLLQRRESGGRPQGSETVWYPEGEVARLVTFSDDGALAEVNAWFQNGQQAERTRYAGGQVDGRRTWWHPNGKLAGMATYVDGAVEGQTTLFHAAGKPALVGTFVDGRLDGDFERWYASGEEMVRGAFMSNMPHGTWEVTSQAGLPVLTIHFVEGRPTGTWVNYLPGTRAPALERDFNAEGALIAVRTYRGPQQLANRCTYGGRRGGLNGAVQMSPNGQVIAELTVDLAQIRPQTIVRQYRDDGSVFAHCTVEELQGRVCKITAADGSALTWLSDSRLLAAHEATSAAECRPMRYSLRRGRFSLGAGGGIREAVTIATSCDDLGEVSACMILYSDEEKPMVACERTTADLRHDALDAGYP